MPDAFRRGGPFRIQVIEEGSLAVVRLSGEFAEPDVEALAGTLENLTPSHRGVLVDLAGVKHIPSRMIAPLVRAALEAGFFAVVVEAGRPERVLRSSGIEETLRLFTDEGSARAAFLASEDACG